MKKLFFKIKQILINLFRAFYSLLKDGENCIVCGQKTFVLPVCKNCQEHFFNVKQVLCQPRCKKCGRVLNSDKEICMECREKVVLNHVDKMLPLFSYLLWNKEVLFLWKINGIRSLSAFFANKINEALKFLCVNYVVPVPPRPGKIQKKGWDQIDELCKFLENVFNYKILHLLERQTTVQQKKLDRIQRLEKIDSAYVSKCGTELVTALKPANGILPSQVCLIDDVCTTGATIEKCAALLKEMGVKNVIAVTLFYV